MVGLCGIEKYSRISSSAVVCPISAQNLAQVEPFSRLLAHLGPLTEYIFTKFTWDDIYTSYKVCHTCALRLIYKMCQHQCFAEDNSQSHTFPVLRERDWLASALGYLHGAI